MSLQFSAVAISNLEITELISSSPSTTSCLNSVKSAVCSITAFRSFSILSWPILNSFCSFLISSCPTFNSLNSSSTIFLKFLRGHFGTPVFTIVLVLYHNYFSFTLYLFIFFKFIIKMMHQGLSLPWFVSLSIQDLVHHGS